MQSLTWTIVICKNIEVKYDIFENAEVKYENAVTTAVTTPKTEAFPNVNKQQTLSPKYYKKYQSPKPNL